MSYSYIGRGRPQNQMSGFFDDLFGRYRNRKADFIPSFFCQSGYEWRDGMCREIDDATMPNERCPVGYAWREGACRNTVLPWGAVDFEEGDRCGVEGGSGVVRKGLCVNVECYPGFVRKVVGPGIFDCVPQGSQYSSSTSYASEDQSSYSENQSETSDQGLFDRVYDFFDDWF